MYILEKRLHRFYFKVSYTDLANCVIDLDDNWFNYAGYEILPTNYKQ